MDRRAIWLSGGLMGALGVLVGLHEVGARLQVLAAQVASFASGPTPRTLDWIAGTARAHRLLATLESWLLPAIALLAMAAAWRLVRLLNPHGTLRPAVMAEEDGAKPLLQTPLEPSLVRRTFAAGLATAYLLGAVPVLIGDDLAMLSPYTWGLPALITLWPARPWLGLLMAFMLGGAALWLLWGEWGVVAPRHSRSSSRSGALARGLLAGSAAFPVLLPLLPWGRGPLDAVLAAVGPAHPAAWRLVLWSLMLGLPAAFFALGLLIHALARPSAGVPKSAAPLITVAALLLACLAGGEAYFITAVAVGRYDFGRDLAALVGASRRPSSSRAFLIFPPAPVPGPLPGFVPTMSIQRIDAGHDSPRRTWQYLERRGFQSALVFDALVHLHDCASLQWDSAESLRVDLACLEQCPQPIFAGLLAEKLSTCATSPENRALLRQAADPNRYAASPEWLNTLAQLHLRFGDRGAAARLLQQAGLEAAAVQAELEREPPLTSGTVAGRLVVDGRPGAGLTVGLLPSVRWQSLVGAPRPFELRWVAAAAPTDADGRFRLRDMGEGEYVLIVMGDPQHLPLQPRGLAPTADGSPGLLALDRAHPARDLHTLRIRTQAVPSAERA
jgi:hypothetical protein